MVAIPILNKFAVVLQGSRTAIVFFLIYVNHLHYAVEGYSVHHLANYKYLNSLVKRIKKQVNQDLKHLANW